MREFPATLLVFKKIDDYLLTIHYNHSIKVNKVINNQLHMSSMTLEIVAQRIQALEKKMELVEATVNQKNSDNTNKDKKEKKEKKEKKKSDSDDDKPKKKRVSGYILYSNANRSETKERLAEEADEKPKNTDVMKELARMWKELDDDEKEVWNDKAKELKEAPVDAE